MSQQKIESAEKFCMEVWLLFNCKENHGKSYVAIVAPLVESRDTAIRQDERNACIEAVQSTDISIDTAPTTHLLVSEISEQGKERDDAR